MERRKSYTSIRVFEPGRAGTVVRSDVRPGWRPAAQTSASGPTWFLPVRADRPLPRLLLGHTMQRAEAPDQVAGVDGNDFAGREELGQNVEREAVVRVIEYRDENNAIRDVE